MQTETAHIVGAPFGTAPGSKGTSFMTALWPVACAGPSPLIALDPDRLAALRQAEQGASAAN
eukprot:9755432-Prorocentrum_lima.AAC.1